MPDNPWRVLFERCPVPVVVFDVESLEVLAANEAAAALHGRSVAELTGIRYGDLLEPGTQGPMPAGQASSSGAPRVERHRRRDGTRLDVEATEHPLPFEGRSAAVAYLRDVSDLTSRREEERARATVEARRAEGALADSERRYRNLVEMSGGLICTHDLTGRILSINRSASAALGYTAEELQGRSLFDLVPPRFQEELNRYLIRVQSRSVEAGLLCLRTREGDERFWDYRNVLCEEKGRHPYVLGNAQDVTERLRAERELAHRMRLASFAAEIGKALTAGRTLDDMLAACADLVCRHLSATRASFWIAGSDGRLSRRASAGDLDALRAPEEEGARDAAAIGEIAATHRALIAVREEVPAGGPERIFAGLPLAVGSRLVGVLAISTGEHFGLAALETIDRVGDELALGIDRALAVAALEEQERRYRLVTEHARDLVAQVTPEGRVLYASPSNAAVLGIPPEEVLSGNAFNIVHPEDAARVRAVAATTVAEGGSTSVEMRVRKRSGEVLHVEALLTALPGGQGLLISSRDITVRKSFERALEASEERYRELFENASDMVYTHDLAGRFLSINRAAERLLGYRRDEVIGTGIDQLVAPEHLQQARESIARKLRGEEDRSVYELDVVTRSGKRVPVEVSTRLVLLDGRPVAVQGVARDVSERRDVERMRREFVATVSHELRTPLTSIRGSLGLLTAKTAGELAPAAERLVAIAERNTTRLIRLINDFLDLERLDSGRMDLTLAPTPLEAVLASSVDAVQGMADEHGVAVEVGPTDLRVIADADRLEQVVLNLLSNAVKFSPRGERIEVSASPRGGEAEVRVVDRGRGVPPGLHDAIFERFRQVDASDSRQKGGTGLGLAISKTIVERHGGSIGILSEEGKGATFWFRVPLAG